MMRSPEHQVLMAVLHCTSSGMLAKHSSSSDFTSKILGQHRMLRQG